jgi:hypothetical protein
MKKTYSQIEREYNDRVMAAMVAKETEEKAVVCKYRAEIQAAKQSRLDDLARHGYINR